MTDFRINVIIDPRGAQQGAARTRRELSGIETAADRLRRTLVRTFGVISTGVAIRELVQLTDAYTGLQTGCEP